MYDYTCHYIRIKLIYNLYIYVYICVYIYYICIIYIYISYLYLHIYIYICIWSYIIIYNHFFSSRCREPVNQRPPIWCLHSVRNYIYRSIWIRSKSCGVWKLCYREGLFGAGRNSEKWRPVTNNFFVTAACARNIYDRNALYRSHWIR